MRRSDHVTSRSEPRAHGIVYTPALDGAHIAVFGDIHGRADLLDRAHERLDAYVARRGLTPPVEIYLGDYIDRGPQSGAVLSTLLARSGRRAVICLRGNHEAMLLDALDDPAARARWLQAGGAATLSSYDGSISASHRGNGAPAYPSLRAIIPSEHIAFLRAMPVGYRLGSMFFVHAGVRPGVLLERQQDADLLWIREPFLSSDANHGALIVHGHTPTIAIEFRHNRINVDTGAVITGLLTCLLIGDDGLHVIGS